MCQTLCDPMECSSPGLPFTISQSLLKLKSIESVMPSNHLILCCPLLLLPLIFPSIRILIILYQSLSVFKYVQLPLSYKTKQKLLLNHMHVYSPWRMVSCLCLNFSTLLYSFTPDNCPSSPLYFSQGSRSDSPDWWVAQKDLRGWDQRQKSYASEHPTLPPGTI